MLNQHRNSKKQGDQGLGAAIAWATEHGFTVSIPLTDSQPYDLIIDCDGLRRVQVKTSTSKDEENVYTVELRSKGGNRSGTGKTKRLSEQEVDNLFVLTPEHRYWIPVRDIRARSAIKLTSMYNQWIVF